MSSRTLALGKCSAALVCAFFAWWAPDLTWLYLGAGLVAFALWDWIAAAGD